MLGWPQKAAAEFGSHALERYRSVVGGSMGTLADLLPGIRDSAGDERQMKKSAEAGANRSSMFYDTTTDSMHGCD